MAVTNAQWAQQYSCHPCASFGKLCLVISQNGCEECELELRQPPNLSPSFANLLRSSAGDKPRCIVSYIPYSAAPPEKGMWLPFSLQMQCGLEGFNKRWALQERGPFSERAVARVLYEALKMVAACHANNVIHGDVKPANFLLRQACKDPMAYLETGNCHGAWLKSVDFGCSQV